MDLDLNAMLARCNFDDVRERAMLLDELHRAGRLEEEEMLAATGRTVEWNTDYAVITTQIDWRSKGDCPFCGFRVPSESGPVCGHVLHVIYSDGPPPPALAEFVEEVKEPIAWFVDALRFMGSPVLPTWRDKEGINREVQLVINHESEYHVATVCAPRPRLFLNRLVNLIRQRAAAGCPIVLPTADA